MTDSEKLPTGDDLTEEALYSILDSLSQVQQFNALVHLSLLWAEYQQAKGGASHG